MALKTLIAPDMMSLRSGPDPLWPVATHALHPCDGMSVNIVIRHGSGGPLACAQNKHDDNRHDNGEEDDIPLSRFPSVLTGHESHYSSGKNSPILVKRQEKSPPERGRLWQSAMQGSPD